MSLFTKVEADRIAALITEVETVTAGEIVVAEEASSDDYAEVRLTLAFGLALISAAALHLCFASWSAGVLLALQVAVVVVAGVLSGWTPLLRWLVPRARAAQAVERAAQLAFLRHGVFRTRDRTGVLIFLSALEHRVVILGDEGIHARNPGWDALVEQLTGAIRDGKAGEGVCSVITQLREPLSSTAPIRPDDTNELPNHVRGR